MEEKIIESIKARHSIAGDKIKSAKFLFGKGYYRDSISRCYYAMYYVAVALLMVRGKKPKTHKGVLNLFGQYFAKNGEIDKTYATMLRVIKRMREDADYKPEVVITKQDAEDCLKKAKEFVNKCNQVIKKYI